MINISIAKSETTRHHVIPDIVQYEGHSTYKILLEKNEGVKLKFETNQTLDLHLV